MSDWSLCQTGCHTPIGKKILGHLPAYRAKFGPDPLAYRARFHPDQRVVLNLGLGLLPAPPAPCPSPCSQRHLLRRNLPVIAPRSSLLSHQRPGSRRRPVGLKWSGRRG